MTFIKPLALSALLLSALPVYADVTITADELIGTWQIDKESSNADGSNGRSSKSQWIIRKDGVIEGITDESGDAQARIKQVRAELSYRVEDGKLVKQAAPGRSKTETCTAQEKGAGKLVLKCASVYYFLSKK